MLDLKIIPNFKHHIFLFFLQKVERPVPLFIFTYGYKKMSIKNGKGQDPCPLSPILSYMYVPATSWAVDKVCFNFAERC